MRFAALPTRDHLLQRCVAELRLCTEILARFEGGIITLINSPIAAEMRIGFQDLDLLRQSLEDITQFMDAFAKAGPDPIEIEEILRALKLQSIRLRLSGGDATGRPIENFVEF
jgi:hypothetical protein